MAIPSRQIGWSNESNLLSYISKQLERLTGVTKSIVGPQGPIGPQGIQGPQGTAGNSVTILGSYANYAAFLAGAGSSPGAHIGDAWIILTDGSLYSWNGSVWFDAGDIQGPPGAQGPQGPQGIQGIQGIPGPTTNLYSATFFDTTTQNNGGATTANQVLINSTQSANGFTLGPNNRINVTNAGTYFFSANMQLSFTGGASNYNVTVWYTVDDVIASNSAFTFTTTGAQNDQTLATITDTIALTAGQYLKFYWWSQATGMKLLSTAAGSNPSRPLSPSVNISIFNVG